MIASIYFICKGLGLLKTVERRRPFVNRFCVSRISAGALNSSEVTLNSANVDLENEFRRRRELAERGIETHGIYANLGTVEVIIF